LPSKEETSPPVLTIWTLVSKGMPVLKAKRWSKKRSKRRGEKGRQKAQSLTKWGRVCCEMGANASRGL